MTGFRQIIVFWLSLCLIICKMEPAFGIVLTTTRHTLPTTQRPANSRGGRTTYFPNLNFTLNWNSSHLSLGIRTLRPLQLAQ
ncbi:hypothetical protein MTO96_038882 [Rhipicephalus appendiculatus]